MKKILLTGASGYVGRNFFDAYKEKYQIQTFSLQKESLDDLDLFAIDTVLHCAALVHQKQPHPQEVYDHINRDYPYELASKAKRSGVKQFVFLSTIAVYGESKTFLTEDTPCKPFSPYGKSKLEAEQKLRSLEDENFTVSIIRPPMIYGKNAPGNIQTLVKLIKKTPLLPFGNIRNKRTFVYIDNLVQMIDTIIEQKASGTFLAGDTTPLSTSILIQLIAEAMDKKIILFKLPFLSIFLQKVKPSLHQKLYTDLIIENQKTLKKIHFSNPFTPQEGIQHMLHGDT